MKNCIHSVLLLLLFFTSCEKQDFDTAADAGNEDPNCGYYASDAVIKYTGSYQSEVITLLSRTKPWKTPSCIIGVSDGIAPKIFSDGNGCIRDTYVDAAIQYAWAAEAAYRFERYSEANDYATQVHSNLNNANSLCSNVPVPGPAPYTCNTFTVWPCNSSSQPSQNGKVMFWVASDFGCGPITVIISGISGQITSFYASTPPSSCGAIGCATFELPPGNYNFSANCASRTWNNTITITANSCFKMRLI